MPKPEKPPRFDEFRNWLIDDLDDEQRLFVRWWIAQYMNQWGQIPVAAHRSSLKNKNPKWFERSE